MEEKDWLDDDFEETSEEVEEADEHHHLIPKDTQHELFGPSLDDYLETSGACHPRRVRSKNKLPPRVAKLMGEANLLYAQGDHESAKEVLQLVIDNNANIPDPYHTLGLICEEKGEISEAAQFYMLAAELSGKSPALWKRTGAMFAQVSDYERAIKCYSRAVRQDPKELESIYQKAMIYEEMGELKRAVAELCHYLEKAPSALDAYKELGRMYYALGEKQQATGVLGQGYRVMKESSGTSQSDATEVDFDLINMYAECKMNAGEWRETLEIVDYAENRRGVGRLLLQLNVKRAICHMYLGNTTMAQIHINYLLDQPVEQWHDLYLEMAECLVACMDYGQALLFFDSLLQVEEYDNAMLWMQIVHCYHSIGNIEKAIQFCERSFDSDRANVDVCLTLSGFYHQQGFPEKGIQVVEKHDACVKDRLAAVKGGASSPTEKTRGGNSSAAVGKDHHRLLDSAAAAADFEDREKELRVLFQKARLMYARRNYSGFTAIITDIFQDRSLLFFRQRRRVTRRILPDETTRDIPAAKRHNSRTSKRLAGAKNDDSEEASQLVKFQSELSFDGDSAAETATMMHLFENRSTGLSASDDLVCGSMSARKNVWELVGMSVFTQILTDYGRCLIYLQQANKETFFLTKTLYDLILEEVAFTEISDHAAKEMRFVIAKVAYASGLYDISTFLVRQICASCPNVQAVWNFFYKATSKSKKFFLSRGFVHRLLNKHPSCVPLLLLSGHMSQMAGSHRMALTSYISAYSLKPKQPLVLLSTGVAFLNLSMSRKNPNRHATIMKAFAFFYSYFIEQVYGTGEGVQEANYNLARAFHQLQLYNFAIPLYNLVLSDLKPAVDVVSSSKECGIIGHLKREAAHNLSLIYRSCGAHHMARKCLREYLTI